MTKHCLNDYQLQFLREMIKRGVRFLVIGGQARNVYHGTRTRDLDLWVDISSQNRPALDLCLMAWAAEHPMHSAANFSPPLPLRPGVQIKFPDDEVFYVGADGEPTAIVPADCIDVLTSIGAADFGKFYDRAEWHEIAGIRLPLLARDDLNVVSPAKSV